MRDFGVDGPSADGAIPPVIATLAVANSFQLSIPFIAALKANGVKTLEAEEGCSKSVCATDLGC